MKKLVVLVLVCGYFFIGCKAISQVKSNYDKCVTDSECLGEMVKNRDISSLVASSAVAAVPQAAPYAALVGSSVGQLIFLLTGAYLGRRRSQ